MAMTMERETVLFVDDDELVLASLKRLLRGEPYRAIFAPSGQAALDMMESENIHVIVTDLGMPGIDGLELLKHVERKYPEAIRLVLSGLGDKASIIDAINRGNVYRYILKPWDNTELKLIVRQAIELHQGKKKAKPPGRPR